MIQIKNLNKVHLNRGENRVKALTDINIDFDEKGITFIAGESGNGKSTLLALIGGIDTYEDGEILVDGVDLKTLTGKELDYYRNNYMDFVIQENTLIPSLTVAENVKLERGFTGEIATDEEVEAALDLVGLKGYGDRMPAEISGGEKRRASVARTLLSDAKVLLVDEPTASLDKRNTEIIWDTLKKYAENHLIIAVTHKEEVMEKYADRIITLKGGQIVEDKRVKKAPKKEEKYNNLRDELKKSRLGLKQTVKLAYSYLSSKKLSFTFVTILSCLSLLFFSVFFILDGYNYNKVLAYSVDTDKTPYISFVNGTTTNSSPIPEETQDKINNSLRKNELYILNSFKNMSQVNFAVDFGSDFYNSGAQNFTIKGLLEVDYEAGSYNSLGQKILSGAYPTSANPDAVVISDYFANLLIKYGAYHEVGGEIRFNETFTGSLTDPYAGLINKKIMTNYGGIKVCGVYQTDYARFVNSDDLAFRGYDRAEFTYKLNNIYSVLHTSSEFVDYYAKEHNTAGNLVATIEKDNHNRYSATNMRATVVNSSTGRVLYFKNGKTLADMRYNEVIISSDLYNRITQGILGYQALNATSFVDVDVNLGEVNFALNTTSHPEANLSLNITLNDSNTNTYEIVGVYKKAADEAGEEIYFSERSYIEDILAATTFSASAKVLYTTVGHDVIEQVINIMYDNGFSFESLNSEEIINYGERITIMKSAFLIASIFMAIYSLVLMYYFISQMIIDKKTDIGILKALGCSKRDVASIFILCSASIALIVFLITVLFTFAVAAITNIVVVSQIPVNISVFTTSGLMYLWIAVMCAVVVAVGTTIPITKYSKLPPKELLKIF